jgi:hypothetical protein
LQPGASVVVVVVVVLVVVVGWQAKVRISPLKHWTGPVQGGGGGQPQFPVQAVL